jgi:hypothetical protein
MASETTTDLALGQTQGAKPAKRVKPQLADGALEKFKVERVHRSAIKGAPYNPRTISDDARRKLRDNLKRVGLLQPLVWNRLSGNMVSGHQRLTQMDDLMGTADYHLTVAVVELDAKSEKEQNIFFNNQQSMGDWDFEKLGEMFKSGELEAYNTGFDAGDIKDLFGGDVLRSDELSELSDAVSKAHDMAQEVSADRDNSQDNNFYTMLVFKDDEVASRVNMWLGIEDARYVDGRKFLSALHDKIMAGEPLPESLAKMAGV